MWFSSTPRGARLARRLVSHRLSEWGHPYTGTVNETVTLIAAELAANAVSHGRLPDRDFHLHLSLPHGLIRVEVTDSRIWTKPALGRSVPVPDPDAESGRGLLLVSLLSHRWGVIPRPDGEPGKIVWAEVKPD
ncbi:hypothetical protein GCM10009716_11520 [Streptomyces sodiiphilus]|uniref:Histidine kinase/HSP90-like ATPase domain-containing protein n=1 Tax=Streptomyces sodiiphilus TaxID=226217 RepID=A0ABN2NU85_9ACTN